MNKKLVAVPLFLAYVYVCIAKINIYYLLMSCLVSLVAMSLCTPKMPGYDKLTRKARLRVRIRENALEFVLAFVIMTLPILLFSEFKALW